MPSDARLVVRSDGIHERASVQLQPRRPTSLPTRRQLLELGIGSGGRTNMLGAFIPNVVAPPPPKPVTAIAEAAHRAHYRGRRCSNGEALRKVTPVYPPLAITARISGVVRLIGTIGKDGTIRNLQLVSGHPMLARAALEAVRQWVYKPTLLNGNARGSDCADRSKFHFGTLGRDLLSRRS